MTGACAILTILAALIPFAIWLYRTHRTKAESPAEQNKKRYEIIESDIARRDSDAATLHGGDDLDELDRLRRARDQQR